MIASHSVIKNIESFGLNYEYAKYLIDVDYEENNKLVNYYENKLKEGSVFEFNYVGPTEKFGVTYHHYKIHKNIVGLPTDYYMPDQKYYNFTFKQNVTSSYFGDYLWAKDTNWDTLYKEKDRLFLIKK